MFCNMFTDDTKMGGQNIDVEIIQSGQLKMAKWAAKNGIVLNASKS